MKTTLQEYLFKDMTGCTNHGCIISPKKIIGTNGSCSCLATMTHTQYCILKGRLTSIADLEIELDDK